MTREEAIHFAECLKNNWTINFADMEEFCDMAIEALQADRPTGEWVKVMDEETPNVTKWHYECDQCGAGRFENGQRYCSRCGAKMDKGGEEDE